MTSANYHRVVYQRDPLSVLYDGDAGEVLDRLYATRMAGGVARTLAYIASPPFAARDDYDGSLTAQERAFQRALYWQAKRRRPRRSIRVNWAPDDIPGLGKPVTVSMFTASAGRAYSERQPEDTQWSMNPAIRSHGQQ